MRVLADQAPFEAGIWLVAHRELKTSRRIRRVYEFLAEGLISHVDLVAKSMKSH